MVFIKITWQLLSIFSSIQKNSIILRGGEDVLGQLATRGFQNGHYGVERDPLSIPLLLGCSKKLLK